MAKKPKVYTLKAKKYRLELTGNPAVLTRGVAPVGGTVRLYKSTDASAPSLTGQVGSLIALLDAVLVGTGGFAYGSTPSAGWSKPYANSGNIGCWRMATSGNSGAYLNINDNGPGAGGAREARVNAYNAMTALDTGTGRFPTNAQLSIGGNGFVIWRKSTTADATARPWFIIADDSCFYLVIETGDYTNQTAPFGMMFGDIFSLQSSDAYRAMIIGRVAENSGSSNYESFSAFTRFSVGPSPMNDYVPGHFLNATYQAAAAASINCGKIPNLHLMHGAGPNAASVVSGGGYTQTQTAICYNGWNAGYYVGMGYPTTLAAMTYPPINMVDGGVIMSPIYVHHNGAIRGYLKGLWSPTAAYRAMYAHGDTFSGAGNLAGKSFINLCLATAYNNGTIEYGSGFFEYSNTWS